MSSYRESVDRRRSDQVVRYIVDITGNVQGVGFRPLLFQLAHEFGIRGQVANSAEGIRLDVEGPPSSVDAFLAEVPRRQPALARIDELRQRQAPGCGHVDFAIVDSDCSGSRTALISPDVAVCDECLAELFDPNDARYRYPFINCTNCGPRFTIVRQVPYDRASTSMECFSMCAACRAEYENPAHRRFHAQPIACPQCGPRAWCCMLDEPNTLPVVPRDAMLTDEAIEQAAVQLADGAIVAIKGLGGFHLTCDASNPGAVERLRQRKHREQRPFAVMVADSEAAAEICDVNPVAESQLASRQRPIVLMRKRSNQSVAEQIAPDNDSLGLMLPYTPLHHLLFVDRNGERRFRALVMTSGNDRDEPIAIGNREAMSRLGKLADAFLLHDRDVLIRADDSVVDCRASDRQPGNREDGCCPAQAPLVIRRARGYVPSPIVLNRPIDPILAVGGHLKNTVAISRGHHVFLSQHLGDLNTIEAMRFFEESISHLRHLVDVEPTIVAHDLHPDYLSTQFAERQTDCRTVAVQHHHAHVAACMAEHTLDGPVIGVALDGTGLGTDGTIWGGELLVATLARFERIAHLRAVPLAGGERAIDQPWRCALSYLWAAFGKALWDLPIPFIRGLDRDRCERLLHAADRGVNSPLTSSCGRLFDAVAALSGLRQQVTYEGQPAIELEMALRSGRSGDSGADRYRLPLIDIDNNSELQAQPFILDGIPLMQALVDDLAERVPVSMVSQRFHQGLVHSLAEAIVRIGAATGIDRAVFGGGCFQNRYLRIHLAALLGESGFQVYCPNQVPANDGGLALGQIAVASALGH